MKNVIVTGGAGFIGSHLVDKLISKGIKVRVLDNLLTGKKENINPKADYYNLDIADLEEYRFEIFEDIDTIFHLAATTSVQESIENPILYNLVNITGTANLLQAAKSTGTVKRFIFSSSSSVYGNAKTPTSEEHPTNPLSPYALSKLIGEQHCKLYSDIYDLDTVCLRYFNVYGDRMNKDGGYKLLFPIFKEQVNTLKPLTINNDGEQRRDFIHVDDIVDANIRVAENVDNFKGNIYNVGNGANCSVNEIADMFNSVSDLRIFNKGIIEPLETLAEMSKIDLDLDWKPKGNLKEWIKDYLKKE